MVPLLLVSLHAACGGSDPETVGAVAVTLRDSAGIEIVEIPAAQIEAAPALSLREDLRIGSVEGDPGTQFFGIGEVEIGPAGTIYVLDVYANTIRVFDPEGQPLRQIGRAGEGPGEFGFQPEAMAVGPGLILVTTRANLLAFDTAGTPLSRTRQTFTGNARPELFAYAPAGWLISGSALRPSGDVDSSRDTLNVHRLDPGGPSFEPVLVRTPSRLWRRSADGRSYYQWMSPRARVSASATGEIYATEGGEYRVSIYAPNGAPSREVRSSMTSAPLSDADLERALAQEIARFSDPAMASGIEERREMGPPPTSPIAGRILAAPSGRFLLERLDLSPIPGESTAPSPAPWDLIDPTTGVVGRLEVPPEAWLQVLTDSHLFAIVTDELDVQYVVRYGIVGDGG